VKRRRFQQNFPLRMTMSMANDHPFQQLFENLGRLPTFHADLVNRRAFEVLSEILVAPLEQPGRCVLLRAPRAGHGKTHLLARLQRTLGASHEFIPLHAPFGCKIDGLSVLTDTLRSLAKPLPASGGLCVFDLVARRLFSLALQPLVKSGEVPCQDREGALAALRLRPIETFDFHHPNAVTAHWARDNFQVLGQRLGLELASRSGAPLRDVAYWVDILFRFSSTAVERASRMEVLAEPIQHPAGLELERLEALLGLLALLKRVVLVADDLEVFATDDSAALRLAGFLGALRQSVDRLDVILSLNRDLWDSAFVPRLSNGMVDRLAEFVVELEPLREDEMVALLDSRVPGLGARVLKRIDREAAGYHARGLLRAAGIEWLKAVAREAAPSAAEISPPNPPEVVNPLPSTPPAPEQSAPPPPPPPPVPEHSTSLDSSTSTVTYSFQASAEGVRAEPRRELPVATQTLPSESIQRPSAPAPPVEDVALRPEPKAGARPEPISHPATGIPDSPKDRGSSAQAEPNRVDELLRQFRERYGRGSL
jgi:hypothetical protein